MRLWSLTVDDERDTYTYRSRDAAGRLMIYVGTRPLSPAELDEVERLIDDEPTTRVNDSDAARLFLRRLIGSVEHNWDGDGGDPPVTR